MIPLFEAYSIIQDKANVVNALMMFLRGGESGVKKLDQDYDYDPRSPGQVDFWIDVAPVTKEGVDDEQAIRVQAHVDLDMCQTSPAEPAVYDPGGGGYPGAGAEYDIKPDIDVYELDFQAVGGPEAVYTGGGGDFTIVKGEDKIREFLTAAGIRPDEFLKAVGDYIESNIPDRLEQDLVDRLD